jgi:hypothetical protein
VRAFLAASPPFLPPYNQYPGEARAQRITFAMAGAYPRPFPPMMPPPQHQHQQFKHQHHQHQHQHQLLLPPPHPMHRPPMMMNDEHQRGGGDQGTPPLLEPAPESAKPPSKRPCRQQSPGPSPPPQLLEPQQEPSGQILAQNYIPSLTGVRQGDLREGVGLLPSLQADFMRVYKVRWCSDIYLVCGMSVYGGIAC